MRKGTAVAVGAPIALVAVLVVEGYLAASAEYLPDDPGYLIEATVGPSTGNPLNLVVLGDSTTAGIGSPTVEESLPVLVAERVAAQLDRPVTVTGIGVSGATTATVLDEQVPLLAGLDPCETAPDSSAPCVVLVVIGSNDVTHATLPWTLRDQTERLLRTIHAETDAPVVLGGIPLFGSATALAQPLRLLVDTYADPLRNAQRAAAADVDSATFVDISALASPRFRGVPEAMSGDDFHPSPIGYGFWADALAPAVAAAVRRW